MKQCSRCRRWLASDAFTVNRSRKDGLQNNCRECQRAYLRELYAANLEYYLTKAKRSNRKRRILSREALAQLKAVPCTDCGQEYPSWVMDFDHVRGEKLFNVSAGAALRAQDMLAEADKCEIVCANCHRQRTQKRLHARP